MKPTDDNEANGSEEPEQVVGDVIGDTAYSQRFVLKILLKFANKDTLQHEIKEPDFENDLCTLWDMTAERAVVIFLHRHDVLDLFTFAIPEIDNGRITEIVIGIIANMCCHKEFADIVLTMDDLLTTILSLLRSTDSRILNQLLRLISSCLYLSEVEDIGVWMTLFSNFDYSDCLLYILKNSTNKDLLITALENINSVCSYCNIEAYREDFYLQFVKDNAFDSLYAAFLELKENHSIEEDENSRLSVITLHITMHLVGFDKIPESYAESRENAVNLIDQIFTEFSYKLVQLKQLEPDLVDVIESANTVISQLATSEIAEPERYFLPSYRMWKTVTSEPENNGQRFVDTDEINAEEYLVSLKTPLSITIGIYMSKCSNSDLMKAMDIIRDDYEMIMNCTGDMTLKECIDGRTANYRDREVVNGEV